MVNIPKYISLDFLCLLIGIFIMTSITYFTIISPLQIVKQISLFKTILILIVPVILGISFFTFGFYEMFKNYKREQAAIDLRYRVEGIELINRLNKHK